MSRPAFLGEIDIHIAYMILMTAPSMYLSNWMALAVLLIPQGRIYVRAFWDYPKFGLPRRPYLVANEGMVILASAFCLGGRFLVVTLTGRD